MAIRKSKINIDTEERSDFDNMMNDVENEVEEQQAEDGLVNRVPELKQLSEDIDKATSTFINATLELESAIQQYQRAEAKLGGAVVSNKVESTLSKHLKKMGMIAGKSHLTLNKDKTCTFTYKTKSYNGTYTYDTNTSTLTITGALGVSTMTCTATVSGNELHMLFDADKLLNVMTGLGSSLTTNATLSTLLKSYNGMMLGWTMTR